MEVRTLHPGERDALLALLDGWDVGDGWRGRDFFRRYLEDDASYADENVWVAVESGELLSCVQIFPRRLRVGGVAVPTGGIGSVYTRADRRGRGLGRRVLGRSVAAMTERGMELALLFAGPVPWYREQGWRSWPAPRSRLERVGPAVADLPTGVALERFDPARDLAAVRSLHERRSARRDGSVVRDDTLWQASLRTAGNPREDFRVARRGGRLVAYVRAIVLHDVLVVSELAGEEPEALGALLAALLAPCAPDPLARPGRTPERRAAVAPDLAAEPGLARVLARRGLRHRRSADASCMLRCLAPSALARRCGEDETLPEETLLARLLPVDRFGFWPADRF